MKKIWQIITSVKNAVGNLVFLALVIGVIFIIVNQDSPTVPESAVLILNPEGVIVEQERPVDPVEQFLAGDEAEDPETLVRDVTDAIELAADDDKIKAIALDLSSLRGASLTVYEDIARKLSDFRNAGKSVYAFAPGYSQTQYYLAAFADRVYVDKDAHPFLGGVFLQGLSGYGFYMKSALDKLQINMHVFKAGDYKDAAEPFTRDDMSEYSKESTRELIDTLWHEYIEAVATQRGITTDALTDYINNYPDLVAAADNDPVKLAIDQKLIDAALTRQEWREEMKAVSGESGDTYSHIGYEQYLAASRPPIPVQNPATDKVAVIVAKGTILDGDQPAGMVGGDSVARLVRQARNDKSIKAIVLRVDSPGGSASASELIRSELAVTQAAGKPVVASMGGLAASGGYWISSTANRIFASESTITGSIGVFAMFPTLDQSVQSLGISVDGVDTTELSGAFNQFRELNPLFERTLQSSVSRTYNKFLSLVSTGRGLSIDEADKIAQGRVWTGSRALEHGLVDAIGNLDDAVTSAAMLADIKDYDVVFLEKQLSPREQLMRQILETSIGVLPSVPAGLLSIVPREIRTLAQMAGTPGVYLQCLACNVRL